MTEVVVEKVTKIGRYVSITLTLTDEGGAHPNIRRQCYMVDMRLGVPVLPTELFKSTDVISAIKTLCISDLRRQAADDGFDLFPGYETLVDLVLSRITSYCFCERELVINFDPYTIAAYAFGPREVVISYEGIQDLLTEDFNRLTVP